MVRVRLTVSLMGLVAILTAWPDSASTVDHGAVSGPLPLASPIRPMKGQRQTYLVQLNEATALNYRGVKAGFTVTKPAPGRKLDRTLGAVESYVGYLLEGSHDRALRAYDPKNGLTVEKRGCVPLLPRS